jgi:hypothetical protein
MIASNCGKKLTILEKIRCVAGEVRLEFVGGNEGIYGEIEGILN